MNPLTLLNPFITNWSSSHFLTAFWQHMGSTLVIACFIAWLYSKGSRLIHKSSTPFILRSHQNIAMMLILLGSAILSFFVFRGLPLSAWITPIFGQLSILSMLLMAQLLPRLLQPSSVTAPLLSLHAWRWIALLGVILSIDLLSLLVFDIYASGYWGLQFSLNLFQKSLPLLWWIVLCGLTRFNWWLILPWLIMLFNLQPSPNIWDAWLDLPLMLVAWTICITHFIHSFRLKFRSQSKVTNSTAHSKSPI